MRKSILPGAALVGMALAAGLSATGRSIVPGPEAQELPKRKKKRTVKKSKSMSGKNEYSRSYYTPAGKNQNCGFYGIHPKSYFRRQDQIGG